MTTTIKLAQIDGAERKVKAVVRGDLAIHAEQTGARAFALTHVPSGLRIDGLYLRAITLKSVLRNLSKLDWSGDAESVRANSGLIDAFIGEVRRVEQGEHWAFRRSMTNLINKHAEAYFKGKAA